MRGNQHVPCSKPNQDISSIRNDLEDDELIGMRIGHEIGDFRQRDCPVAVKQRFFQGEDLNVVELHTLEVMGISSSKVQAMGA